MPRKRYGRDSAAYPFTTENLSHLFPNLHRINGSVLAVAGSGDHIFEAILHGASSITGFDVSLNSLAWVALKRTAILKLDFEAFYRFILPGESALSYEVYKRLRYLLSDELRVVIDQQYEANEKDGCLFRSSTFFNTKHEMDYGAPERVSYLEPQRYALLQRLLETTPIELIQGEIQELPSLVRVRAPFHGIILSNISDYAKEICGEDEGYAKRFFSEIISPLTAILSPDGFIAAAYLYATDRVKAKLEYERSEIDSATKREQIFADLKLGVEEVSFPGVNPGTMDSVLILRNEKNEERRAA